MAARRSQPEPPPIEAIELTPTQIRGQIHRLGVRAAEVRALATDRVRHNDPRREVVTEAVRYTILENFGPNSLEWREHQYLQIWDGALHIGMEEEELQAGFEAGIVRTMATLQGFIARLEERLADGADDPVARARDTFEGLALHPRIAGVATPLYRDGHYANAVLNASLTLVNFVQEKSGRFDLDGAPLMMTVFSANKPRLAFNALADQTDQDEQQGERWQSGLDARLGYGYAARRCPTEL